MEPPDAAVTKQALIARIRETHPHVSEQELDAKSLDELIDWEDLAEPAEELATISQHNYIGLLASTAVRNNGNLALVKELRPLAREPRLTKAQASNAIDILLHQVEPTRQQRQDIVERGMPGWPKSTRAVGWHFHTAAEASTALGS